jgi:hypothetical protein
MAELDAALALRNARLRAWYTHGVSVEGGWRWEARADEVPRRLGFVVRCQNCGQTGSASLRAYRLRRASARGLVLRERAALARLLTACSYLHPLLGPEPPELRELLGLELLAGEPPRESLPTPRGAR